MIKMLYALIAIAVMFGANFLITYARSLDKGWLRGILSLVAYSLWLPIIIFAWAALM